MALFNKPNVKNSPLYNERQQLLKPRPAKALTVRNIRPPLSPFSLVEQLSKQHEYSIKDLMKPMPSKQERMYANICE